MKKKIFKLVLLLLLLAIIFVVGFVERRVILLSKLDNSVKNYEDTKKNIYIKMNHSENNTSIELFIKDDIEKSVIKREDGNITIMQFIYPTERKIFSEAEGKKTLSVYEETASKRTSDVYAAESTHTVITNFANTMNFSEKILLAFHTGIRKAEMDGKECYELHGLHSPAFTYRENSVGVSAYVEKDTGLPIKLIETIEENGETKEYMTTYEIKFDCVTDEDIAEPNEAEYEIQEST